MGRTIPSITYRIDERFRRWERFCCLLPMRDRASFRKLLSIARDRRTAIDAADEDLDVAVLLAIAVHLQSEIDRGEPHDKRGPAEAEEPQGRLERP
jgi:hypothetical protein